MEQGPDNRNKIIMTIIATAAVLCGLAYLFSRSVSPSTPTQESTATTTQSIGLATSSRVGTGGVTITTGSSTAGGSYTIKLITAGKAPVAPNYMAPVAYDPTLSVDERASFASQIAQAQALIAKNKQSFDAWIALGDARKEAGDYAGAEADWRYISELYPTNVVSNANLADLYTNYLHDYPKAAAAYKAAIANDPKQTYLYADLATLYTYQYPQPKSVIIAVLNQGLAANPSDPGLKAMLAKLQ